MGATRLIRAIFQRFADPAMEQAYRREQRLRQGRFVRALAAIAVASLLAYWVFLALRSEWAMLATVAGSQAALVPVLLLYVWFVGQPQYADGWWADVVLFSVVQLLLQRPADAVAAATAPGWPLPAQLTYGLLSAMAFACIAIAAAFGAYLLLAALSVAYLVAMLGGGGFAGDAVAYSVFAYAITLLLLCYLNWAIDDKARGQFRARAELDREFKRSEGLLADVLPPAVVQRLKRNQAVADSYDEVVVIFSDLVGFTVLSQQLGPQRIVELLNAFFERADYGTDLFGLDKVKTIGDAYMAVAGAMTRPPRPAKAAIDFALFLRNEAHLVGQRFGVELKVHVGISSGPVLGGVISAKRLVYDYWGHTVNLAARLQDSVGADGIAVSQAVRDAVGDAYPFAPVRTIALKGVGETPVHDLAVPPE